MLDHPVTERFAENDLATLLCWLGIQPDTFIEAQGAYLCLFESAGAR
jgi:hypothetical protein